MTRSLVGPKIRERRKLVGMTQSALAAAAGISASYLNLIEANRRSIGGGLLTRIADQLGLAIDELDGAAERRLVDDLAELCGDSFLAGIRLDPDSAADLAGRHPGWARALIGLHRSWLDRGQAVTAMSDRLNQDPFLGDAVHSVLSRVAAIQSSSEILESVEELRPEERKRFIAIVRAESGRLADVTQALAGYFDKAHTATRSITPMEEVDDFLFDCDNHFATLEAAARDFRAACGAQGECHDALLIDYLQRVHGVQVRMVMAAEPADATLRGAASFDERSRTLRIVDGAAPATRRFALARLATDLFHQGRAVAALVDSSPLLRSDAARRRARHVLSSYLAGAVLMPYEPFHDAAVRLRYDIDLLARRFGTGFEQVCHRLVSLRRPGASGIPFGMMRTGPSGHVSKRFPLPHLPMPRHGNACPLWAVHTAFQTPGAVIRQLAEFPTGDRFLFLARTVEKPRPAFSMPRRMLSIMLACDALYADRTVYAEGLDLSSSSPAAPVGPFCRVCVRRDCLYREEDAIIDA
jgi:predicted transcriptional regulator/transcriptional regulator with XRE-family HTH domain